MKPTRCKTLYFFLLLLLATVVQAQKINGEYSNEAFMFEAHNLQKFGFDRLTYREWSDYYEGYTVGATSIFTAHKTLAVGATDIGQLNFAGSEAVNWNNLELVVSADSVKLAFTKVTTNTITFQYPKNEKDYFVSAYYKGFLVAKIHVHILNLITERIVIVPLQNTEFSKDSLVSRLNRVFFSAQMQFVFDFQQPFFRSDVDGNELFRNPSPDHDRYTEQMKELRDAYLEKNPMFDRKSLLIFLLPGFDNPKLNGYTVRGKSVGFVKVQSAEKMANSIAKLVGFSIGKLDNSWLNNGPKRGTTNNFMDFSADKHLTFFQWNDLRSENRVFSYFDPYENVRSNSGMVAFYFWKELPNGQIQISDGDLIKTIGHPFKKNQFSYHLNVTNVLFKTAFTIKGRIICWLHIFVFLLLIVAGEFAGRKWRKRLVARFKRPRIYQFIVRTLQWALIYTVFYGCFLWINQGFLWYEVKEGIVSELHGKTQKESERIIGLNRNWKHKNVSELGTEILMKRGEEWIVSTKKRVQYFHVVLDKNGKHVSAKWVKTSDSLLLPTKKIKLHAQTHYVVLLCHDQKGKLILEKVYNHVGVDLTNKMFLPDPAKRILVFVNGYRPTSLGHTFEENFFDIQNKGLEYPVTNNLLYDFDRYDYWRPWKEFDLQFQRRINPTETVYADGHHSVSTSNHRSLLNFTTISTSYPKRCKNKKKHTCYWTQTLGGLKPKKVKTITMHRMRSNKRGFKMRMENGRIAGKNLIQQLNELPNRSKNDTVYVVAHSMGYAYALGMIEELRGKVQFGSLYILAPENAKAGIVRESEWKQVWQYGSNFNGEKGDAPCLLDGVAPQMRVGGLSVQNRIYIPYKYYSRKGFFNSHFIGYYTWIFQIKKNKPGYIVQH